ncbi:MAG TPA: DNA methyltransferase, partial [Candidatus Nitrosotenuis sp.]|nr:DNA methyltransferase [Candidatus Nitrosotenuis sp.]
LFLFAAEDRDLLLDPAAPEEARQRYQAWYSTRRLRDLAERHRGTHHGDLWHGLRLVMQKLGEDGGCPALALPALGSFLWSGQALPDLEGCELANRDLLGALRQLAYLQQDQALLPVDFKNLGAEELGSVYESLLELHPELNLEAGSFELKVAAGHERRRTGSYYTPRELVQCLLDSALEPVVADRLAQARRAARAARHSPEQTRADLEGALLDLKVCDPACGSGHFLIAAAHRLARHLATVRSGEEEPSPPELRRALRDVVGHCLYGVDVNEMAVELCKVALWMEALEPGRPLSFLDSKIQCGNSLLGTTPALLAAGIPDEAFTDLEGDDKKVAAAHKKRHRQERKSGQRTLRHVGTISITARDLPGAHLGSEEGISAGRLTAEATRLEAVDDRTIAGVREKEARYQALLASSTYRRPRLAADAWCAAFLWPRKQGMEAITEATFRQIVAEPEAVSSALLDQVERLARDHCFFHWHLAFPGVFKVLPPERLEELARRAREGNQDPDRAPEPAHPGWEGGFDVALGNPPWERIKIQEREWFAERVPEIAAAPTAAERKRLIEALREKEAGLYQAFQEDLRKAEGESHFLRNSGRYPLCGVGDINTYAVFAETMRALLGPTGRLGCILPPGLATDNTTRHFFRDLVARGQLACLYTFENEERIFPAVDHRVNFTLLTLAGPGKPVAQADFVWFARRAEDLKDLPRHFALTAADIELLNPNTGTCPIFRSSRDAELNKSIYRRVPVLVREGPPEENPWKLEFMAMLHMANDSHLFRTRGQLEQENRHKGGQGEEEPREPEPQGAGPGKGESRSRALPGASSASRPGAGTPEGQGWRLQGNLFCRGSERYLPLYEAKMLHHFDHRFGTYEGQTEAQARMNKLPELTAEQHADLHFLPLPRYWVPAEEVEKRLQGRWDRGWLLGWRDICRTTDERTVIASLLPRVGVGHTVPLMLTLEKPAAVACLYASLCSFIFDYLARQKVGGTHLTYNYLKQLPVLPPSTYQAPCPWSPGQTLADWILPRVLELTYTAWDLEPFARDCGYTGPPFPWDEERRFRLRCELDAAYFHLYGLEEEEVAYVMDTFPIVRRRDEAAHGSFRTKETILHIYRELQARGSSSQGPTGSIFAARLQIRAGNAPGPAGRQGEGSP